MYSEFYKKYQSLLAEQYPSAQGKIEAESLTKLISPHSVELQASTLNSIQNCIKSFYRLAHEEAYQDQLQSKFTNYLDLPSQPSSLLMAYDFHLSGDGPKIIEVNTNASGFLLSELIYQTKDTPNPSKDLLSQAFLNEFNTDLSLAIIDENILEQKMYIEFLMYKDFLNQAGLKTHILNFDDPAVSEFKQFYNRYCDFYLSEDRSSHLLNMYLKEEAHFSPQPRDYLLFADKQRLIELGAQRPLFPTVSNFILDSLDIKQHDSDTLWKNKKKYFFKPKNSFGSKSTYRGKNLSRKHFERMLQEDTIVQELCPPPETVIKETKWKYDIRAYAYKDKLQMIVARIYQGQLTNFKTDFGGFCAVTIKD